MSFKIISSVQPLSHVQLLATAWIVAHQASLPGTIMGGPTHDRSWRKYQAGKAVQDPIHDEVMAKKPDRQGRLG